MLDREINWSKTMQNKPGVLMGAFIGGLLMLPVIAISFLGQQLASLPFIPAILFAFGRDSAPGDMVPRIIGLMSDTIVALNLGRVDVVAKQVEYGIELFTLLILGIVAGAVFFAVRRRGQSQQDTSLPGLILGVVTAALIIVMLLFVPQSVESPLLVSAIWIAVLMIAWGLAVNWAYNTLTLRTVSAAPVPAAAGVPLDRGGAEGVNRRQFLVQVGVASATITVIGAGIGSLLGNRRSSTSVSSGSAESTPSAEVAALTNPEGVVTPAPGTRPEITPLEDHYRIDIATLPPRVDGANYVLPFTTSLTSDGSQQTIAEMTLNDIRNNYEPEEAYITMSCISNWVGGDLISTIKWTGVSMQRILADIAVPENATHIRITAADGFDETVALDLIHADPRVMLAYAWEDQPLTVEHGFPLRIHVPNHFGMKQPKWITGMEFVAADLDGYWVRRGWDKQAIARATAVIDTVATRNVYTDDNGQQRVPIGGMAWAGTRGISRVEIRVDDGDWQEAQVRPPISDRTWQLWRYDWPFAEGDHTFEVRCFEGDGTPQIEDRRSEYPSGATGYHSVDVSV